ncbi:spore germination protein [Aneurinibacillus aneurinilyticus]|nr:spore germination protein [Aneurinibacillus aneurinilyticus]MED0706103.1 spore germination protein [Aneurinibacillus aneurinilyticus]MED0725077.1 spore germination protein [Aneurinibacillus aneurinilyticus]MED0732677.1 spore germination protein [Aneurinibacillus aneurinilyticus]MED0739814.1 spore germination protein [Aneurinibacillus aneurinilyticus]
MRRRFLRTQKRTKPPYEAFPREYIKASISLEENKTHIENAFHHSQDVMHRELTWNGKKGLLFFLDILVDKDKVQDDIIRPILSAGEGKLEEIVHIAGIQKTSDISKAITGLLKGQCIFLTEHDDTLYLLEAFNALGRSIEEPANEKIIRGSHEGFVESLSTNLYLLRKRIKNPNLTVKYITLGKTSNTRVAVVYLHGLTNPQLIEEVEKRLQSISADSIQTPGYIEDYIEDNSFSPFPQALNTERPDKTAANIIEGRAAIIMEGNPSALIVPVTFFSFYQSPDDFNDRWHIGSFFRAVRILSFFITIVLPAFYIAVVTFHHEVIPLDLIFNVKSSLQHVPFPPILEAMIMQVMLELLREAAIRLPTPIAQTIGIVGGLVIGNAVVQASLISNTMIIIVAVTAISSFVVPSAEMSTAIRLLGFPLMIGAATLGFFGIMFGIILILIHLCKLESFGTPYFAPFAPLRIKDWKDAFIRLPVWIQNERPLDAKPQYLKREWFSRGWKRNGNKK